MQSVKQVISETIKKVFDIEIEPDVTRPEPQFGDFATNVAMQLVRQIGKNPREIAEALAAELRQTVDFASVDIAGPGFLNIRLSDMALLAGLSVDVPKKLDSTKIVLEYSCPNYFKELHAGHLYQTIIGDVYGRLLERGGADVARTNFGGDVGLHVAKSMWGLEQKLSGFNVEAALALPIEQRTQFVAEAYVMGAKAYESDDRAKEQIDQLNKRVYEIQADDDHDGADAKVYWECHGWSLEYFKALYESIDATPFDRFYPESETAGPGLEVVRSHPDVFTESDGATVYRGEDKGLHTRVFITSEGLPTYETKDLGVIRLEHEAYAFDQRYIVTGNEQAEYMKVVFAAAADTMPEVAGKMTHITNGTIRFGDGQKMSSRLGNVSRAVDVLSTVLDRVRESGTDEPTVIALGAVRYSFMKQRVGGDIAFDLQESVSLQGNSGPYLQYAAVRAGSILSKTGSVPALRPDEQLTADERVFVQKLAAYSDVLTAAIDELAPQTLCTYLYELAQSFNRFYEHNRVLGDEREALRLGLVAHYQHVLVDGLGLLGIRVPEKM